ncbi:hypothetical protein ACJZ2D_001812 [Fusarium nematophilum]
MDSTQDTDGLNLDARYDSSEAWETDPEDGSDSSWHDGNPMYKDWDNLSFPQFKRLPRELRIRIWELFCPQLGTEPQALEFNFQVDPVHPSYLSPRQNPHMRHSTKNVRRVLAVHRESRAIAEQALPSALRFRSSRKPMREALVRFRPERDIVFIADIERLGNLQYPRPRQKQPLRASDFANHVQNVGFLSDNIQKEDNRFIFLLQCLAQLKRVYYVSAVKTPHGTSAPGWSWFSTESCYQKRLYFGFETTVYCWPKPSRESEAEGMAPADAVARAQPLREHAEKYGWKLLPMVGVRDSTFRYDPQNMPGFVVMRATPSGHWIRDGEPMPPMGSIPGFVDEFSDDDEFPDFYDEFDSDNELPSDVDSAEEAEYWQERSEAIVLDDGCLGGSEAPSPDGRSYVEFDFDRSDSGRDLFLDHIIRDSFPNLPTITASAQNGCDFCTFLKDLLRSEEAYYLFEDLIPGFVEIQDVRVSQEKEGSVLKYSVVAVWFDEEGAPFDSVFRQEMFPCDLICRVQPLTRKGDENE